jgi:hypothetical protein
VTREREFGDAVDAPHGLGAGVRVVDEVADGGVRVGHVGERLVAAGGVFKRGRSSAQRRGELSVAVDRELEPLD